MEQCAHKAQNHHAVLPDLLFQGVFAAAAPAAMSLGMVWSGVLFNIITFWLYYINIMHRSNLQVHHNNEDKHERGGMAGLQSLKQSWVTVRLKHIISDNSANILSYVFR